MEQLYVDKDYIYQKLSRLFGHIPPFMHASVMDAIRVMRYRRKEIIYNIGEHTSEFMFLIDGKAKIFREGVSGRRQILRIVTQGQHFGYEPLLTDEAHQNTAMAFEDCIIARIPMTTIDELLHSNLRIANVVITTLAKELVATERQLLNLTQKHMRGRMADSLLMLRKACGTCEDGKTINIRITRQDIADMSNMNTANAIRTLSEFSAEGIIMIANRMIAIIDEERLKKISRLG